MSSRTFKWLLWLVLIGTVPLPYFMIESGRIPAVQLFVFAAVTAPLVVTDPGFTTRFVAALFVSQSLGYGALLYLVARTLGRRVPTARGRIALLAAAVAVLAVVALLKVYRSPLSHGPGATNLIGVFE
jgi:hypothetical protein